MPVVRTMDSLSSCTNAQHPQHQLVQKSPQPPPRIPYFSRVEVRFMNCRIHAAPKHDSAYHAKHWNQEKGKSDQQQGSTGGLSTRGEKREQVIELLIMGTHTEELHPLDSGSPCSLAYVLPYRTHGHQVAMQPCQNKGISLRRVFRPRPDFLDGEMVHKNSHVPNGEQQSQSPKVHSPWAPGGP